MAAFSLVLLGEAPALPTLAAGTLIGMAVGAGFVYLGASMWPALVHLQRFLADPPWRS